jgi:hypothetical protein
MSDDPKDVVEAAIRSAFVSYPREDEPDWRSPHWIKPDECTHLAKVVIRELETKGFRIVKQPDGQARAWLRRAGGPTPLEEGLNRLVQRRGGDDG